MLYGAIQCDIMKTSRRHFCPIILLTAISKSRTLEDKNHVHLATPSLPLCFGEVKHFKWGSDCQLGTVRLRNLLDPKPWVLDCCRWSPIQQLLTGVLLKFLYTNTSTNMILLCPIWEQPEWKSIPNVDITWCKMCSNNMDDLPFKLGILPTVCCKIYLFLVIPTGIPWEKTPYRIYLHIISKLWQVADCND